MNIDLSRIIRESIDDLIYDDIISEAIDDTVLLAEARDDTKRARYERELNKLKKAAKKLGLQDEDIDKLSDVKLKKLIKQAKEENKNKNLTQTGPVKTDDAKELDKNSSVDGVDPKVGPVNPVAPENTEGKGSEIPVYDGESTNYIIPTTKIDGDDGEPANGEKPTTGGESRTGEERTTTDGETPTGTDPTNPEGKTDQTDKTQETAQQLFEKYNFKQYSDQLRRLIGNGIDPKPVADDQNAVKFINGFNQFLYAVITAIENNSIAKVPGSNGGYGSVGPYRNPYEESPFRTAIQAPGNIIGAAADAAEGAVSAVPGLNQLYGGVFGAFNKGRNEQERLNNQIRSNYIQYQNAKNSSQDIGNTVNVQGNSLSELMLGNNSPYASMNAYYQNANGTNNGKLNSIAVIPQCFDVLRQLYNALVQYQQEMQKLAQQAQQARQQGQQGQNTENGGDQEQINEDKPRPDYAKYESDIENDRQKLENKQVNIGKISDDASVCADGMIKLMASVVSAINNNIYYTEDDKNGNSSSLTALMSLNGNDNPENITFNAINEIYSNLINSYDKEDSVYGVIESSLGKPLTLLNKFRNQMKTDGVVENGGATSVGTSAPETSGNDDETGGETTNTKQANNTNDGLENESNEQEMKFNSRVNELNKMYRFDKYGNSSISEGSALFREHGDELREKGEQEEAKHNLNISIGLQTMNNVALSMIRNGRNADEKMLNNWYENLIYADKMFNKSNKILNEKSKQNYIKTYNYLSNFYQEIEKGEYK